MIRVITTKDIDFLLYETELREMYCASQEKITDTNSFEFILKNTLFAAFVDDDIGLIGAIYFFKDEEKLFLNAYAGRKHFEKNVECVKLSTTWFNCEIYAEAQNRASALCLLRSGFKRLCGKLFIFKHEERKDYDF